VTSIKDSKWDRREPSKKPPISDQNKRLMVDYLRAGLKMDKSRDELLDELARKYQRSTRQIERYIAQLSPPAANERYEETPHRQKIRELAKTLARETKIPTFWDNDLWRDLPVEFKRGKYSLPIGEIEISRDRGIKVTYSDIGAGIAEPYLLKGLFSHLRSSGSRRFVELVDEEGQLHSLALEIEQYSQALLVFFRLLVDDVKGYEAKVNFHDEAKPGLMRWFIITAWYCVLWSAFGHGEIDDSLYRPHESIHGTGLWQLRFGAYAIGVARSEKTLETYKNWHKELRIRYAKHPLAKDVVRKYQRLGETVQDITQRLKEFSDMQNLPGHCHLCRPSGNLDASKPQDRTKQKRNKRLK
jgi:hypothetical protein